LSKEEKVRKKAGGEGRSLGTTCKKDGRESPFAGSQKKRGACPKK